MSKESKQMKKLAKIVTDNGMEYLNKGKLNISDNLQFDARYSEKTNKIHCLMYITVGERAEFEISKDMISERHIRKMEAIVVSYLKELIKEKPDAKYEREMTYGEAITDSGA